LQGEGPVAELRFVPPQQHGRGAVDVQYGPLGIERHESDGCELAEFWISDTGPLPFRAGLAQLAVLRFQLLQACFHLAERGFPRRRLGRGQSAWLQETLANAQPAKSVRQDGFTRSGCVGNGHSNWPQLS